MAADMAADTEVLPPDPARARRPPLLGVHPLNPRHCVVEISLRPLGIALLRTRLLAVAGELVVTDAAGFPFGSLRLELSATPTKASLPLANRLLRKVIPGSYRLVITVPGIELFGGSFLMHADGAMHRKPLAQPAEPASQETRPGPPGPQARGSAQDDASAARWPLCLLVRSIESGALGESDIIVLALRGRLRQPRKPPKVSPVLSLLRPWIRVETAAEFSR